MALVGGGGGGHSDKDKYADERSNWPSRKLGDPWATGLAGGSVLVRLHEFQSDSLS
jgi:hypothetical protein